MEGNLVRDIQNDSHVWIKVNGRIFFAVIKLHLPWLIIMLYDVIIFIKFLL